MASKLRAWLGRHIDGRDVLGAAGLIALGVGGEMLHRGAGMTAAGAVMVAIAVLVR